METLIQADIFFFITSIAVILVTILCIVLLAYGVKIARTVSSIATTIKEESENVIEDIAELRGKVKEEGVKVSAFWRFVTGFILNRFADKFTSSSTNSSKSEKRSRAKKQHVEDVE